MKHALGRTCRAALAEYAMSNLAVVLDYDGTLAPIVAEPARAFMRSRTAALVQRVAERYPTAVLSGRARRDLRRFLAGTGIDFLVGSHGADWGSPRDATRGIERRVRRWADTLAAALAGVDGIEIERKRLSLAVHYRRAVDKRHARASLMRALARIDGARMQRAKQAINLVPADAPDKGTALVRIMACLSCDAAIYVGDDVTDEDVFALERPDRLLTVRVGAHPRSRARLHLRDQREIDRLLALLVELRATCSPR